MQRMTSAVRDRLLPAAARLRPRDWERRDDTVLVFQPDHLGDILLSQPAVRHLRARYPGSRLVAVVGPWSCEIAEMAWPVDEVVTVDFPGFTRSPAGTLASPYRQLAEDADRLRAYHARTAFVLRPDGWWAAWLASLVAPEVVTADDPRARRFSTRSVTAGAEHASLRAFRIASDAASKSDVTAINAPLQLGTSPDAEDQAVSLLRSHGIDGDYVVIHPGSGARVKEWPVFRWQVVANALAVAGYRIVVTGSHAERELADQVATDGSGFINLAGETSLPVLAELLRHARLVLGPDCGPLHLAVVTATPTIHLFGPSDPLRYGPWGNPDRHRVVSAGWHCPRCGDLSVGRDAGCGCMLAILPDQVITTARTMLAEHAG